MADRPERGQEAVKRDGWRDQDAAYTSFALTALQKLDKEYPANGPLQLALVKLLFAQDRDEEALAILYEMANQPLARDDGDDCSHG